MTLAALRDTQQIDGAAVPTIVELPAAIDINYAGGMACINTAGFIEPAGASAGQSAVVGRVEETVDNSAGATGDLNVKILLGQFKWDNNGTSIAATDRGKLCYAVDDEAVDISNAGGRPIAGTIMRVDTDGVVVQTLFPFAALSGAATAGADGSSPVYHARSASTANVANLAAFVVANDGVACVEGDRVLLKDQAAADENGIYVLGVVAGTAPLTRALDFDDGSEVVANAIVAVAEGTANADTAWEITSNDDIVVGTDNIVFAETAFGYGLAADMVDQTIAADNAGTELTAARIDHNHAFTTAAAVATYQTNAEGVATTFARSDHTHAVTGIPYVVANATFTSADLTAAAVTQTLDIGAVLDQNIIVIGYRITLTDAFDNAAMATLVIEVGHDNDADAYEDSFDVFTGSGLEGAGWTYVTPGPGIGVSAFDGTSTGQCQCTFTGNADQVLNVTNGSVEIDIIGVLVP